MSIFVSETRKQDETCDYGQFVKEYLGQSCLPGILDTYHEVTVSDDKLCEICLGGYNSRSKHFGICYCNYN